jgi:hypothetical protein
MKKIAIASGLILLLAVSASAEGYLKPTCQSILKNDLINLIKVDSINKDGTQNILIGTKINGVLYNYIYKDADCTLEWTANSNGGWAYNTQGDVQSFVVAGVDGDGKNQIVINSVKSNHPGATAVNQYVRTVSGNGIEDWNFQSSCGFTNAVDAADVDATGRPNVIMGTASNNICALKDTVKQKEPVLWTYKVKYPVYFVKSADLDGAGGLETIALSDKYMDAYVTALDKDGKLLWEKRIEGGVYTAAIASDLIDVADIDGDGKAETVIGTYNKGLIVLDSKGAEKWRYDTGKLVSSILVDDINGDGKKEVIVGSSPKVIALDSAGGLVWTWTGNTDRTIYSLSASDVNGDGGKEIALGTYKFIHVLGDDGKLKGSWKYIIEIVGNKAVEERDANAVAVYMGDIDGDGAAEVVAGWNWEQGITAIMGNQYSTEVRVYEINKDYVPGESEAAVTETTMPEAGAASAQGDEGGQVEGGQAAGEGAPEEPAAGAEAASGEKKGKIPCIPAFPMVLAFAAALLARVPLAATRD